KGLRREDKATALELCAADPVANVLAAVQAEALGTRRFASGALIGIWHNAALEGMCWMGANLVPVGLHSAALLEAAASHVKERGQRCSSIVGPAEQVHGLWQRLAPRWSAPRDVRDHQPSMAISAAPDVAPDERVRPSTADDLDVLIPACVTMFTEEVGYSPMVAGGAYAARVRELVTQQRSFIRTEEGPDGRRVVFKAE